MSNLSDKEIYLLEQISRKNIMSQRELARKTGISLGLINVLLKKLLRDGHIRVSHLNKKKLEYQPTGLGLVATARKMQVQTAKIIRNYRQIQEGLAALLQDLKQEGIRYFSIHGDGELRDLLESIFHSLLDASEVTLGDQHLDAPHAVVLNLTPSPFGPEFQGNVVSVLEKLGGLYE